MDVSLIPDIQPIASKNWLPFKLEKEDTTKTQSTETADKKEGKHLDEMIREMIEIKSAKSEAIDKEKVGLT